MPSHPLYPPYIILGEVLRKGAIALSPVKGSAFAPIILGASPSIRRLNITGVVQLFPDYSRNPARCRHPLDFAQVAPLPVPTVGAETPCTLPLKIRPYRDCMT